MNEEIRKAIEDQQLIFAVLSGIRKGVGEGPDKMDIKPVVVKEAFHYQITSYYGQKVNHENVSEKRLWELLQRWLGPYFKQGMLYTAGADYQILFSKKMKEKVLKKPPSRFLTTPQHNRTKNYIIPEGVPCDFMVHLGVMDASGRVYKKRYDKFRQLNKYLEFVSDALGHLNQNGRIRIIDFGCGKAYLTFALYYYLVKQLNLDVEIVGLDLKEDVIDFCNQTAEALGYENLIFKKGDIRHYEQEGDLEMVVSLHACDTATDEALIKAVEWHAKVILAVPCCQHELFNQLKNPAMDPILKYGVLKDKMATMVTDALRGLALETKGYEVQMMEFIDMEHTPKNVLMRAYAHGLHSGLMEKSLAEYESFKSEWGVSPYIDKLVYKIFE